MSFGNNFWISAFSISYIKFIIKLCIKPFRVRKLVKFREWDEQERQRRILWSATPFGYVWHQLSKIKLMLKNSASLNPFDEQYWIWALHVYIARQFAIGRERFCYPVRKYLKEVLLFINPVEIHFILKDQLRENPRWMPKIYALLSETFKALGIDKWLNWTVLPDDSGRDHLVERWVIR